MPTSSREIAENFIVSAVQAITACGEIRSYSINASNRRVVQTHADGCVLEVPFESIRYMNREQFRRIFATLSRNDLAILQNMATAEAPAQPALPAELPAIDVDETRIRRALTLESRQSMVRSMVDNNYNLSIRYTDRVTRNQRTNKTARGELFITGLGYLGLKLPKLFALPVGDVLHAMYSNIEDQVTAYKDRLDELQSAYQRKTEENTEAITKYASDVAAAKADATRLTTLRDAAVAWRTSTGTVEEKFEHFTAMMTAIDNLSATAPEAPEAATAAPLLTAEQAAEQAAQDEAFTTAAPQGAEVELAGTTRL